MLKQRWNWIYDEDKYFKLHSNSTATFENEFFFYKELHLNCNLISSVSTKELAEGTSVLEGEKVTFLVYRVK